MSSQSPNDQAAQKWNISHWAINNPVTITVVFFLLTFFGWQSLQSLKVQNMPDLDLPTVLVSVVQPGASPTQLENQVIRKIENSLAKLQGLRHIVRVDLPADLREPVVKKLDLSNAPVLAYTIAASNLDAEALSWFVEHTVSKRLLSQPGVGGVTCIGCVHREIQVSLDAAKLQSLNASATTVSRQLALTQLETSGGKARLSGHDQPIRTIATVSSAEALAITPIVLPDGRHFQLRDLAEVKDHYAEPTSAAYLDGEPVLGFEVSRRRGASEIEVAQHIQQALKQLASEHPGVVFNEAFNFVTPVQDEFDASISMLLEGAMLAVLVVWVFLRNLRATFVSAVALPLSIIPTFIGLDLLGYSINLVTLLALSLVIGVLVDDAIVEVENIVRHTRGGKTPYRAAIEATEEIGLAVIATTFTLVAVFLPTAFLNGIPGKFFKQFGWTAALAVMASLLVARLLTPVMAAFMMKPQAEHPAPSWMPHYLKAIRYCLKNRTVTMLSALALMVLSVMMIPLLPVGFMPADDNSQTQVRLELPPGATLQETTEKSELARNMLMQLPEVEQIYTNIGAGQIGEDAFAGLGKSDVRHATLTIKLQPRGQRPKKQIIETKIRATIQPITGVRTKVGLGASGEKYHIALNGEQPDKLLKTARQLERQLRTIPGIGSISSSATLERQEIVAKPDLQRAADLGVTTAAIGETLRIATEGDYEQSLAKLNLEQRQVPIVVKLQSSAKTNLALLGKLTVQGANGPVPLDQVCQLSIENGPAEIARYDRERSIRINIELGEQSLGDVADAVKALPLIQQLPAGISFREIGDAEMMQELFSNFSTAMVTGCLCIYVILVLLFKSFLQPITLLVALPLSLCGAFTALLLGGQAFSMPSLIGLVMLLGIVCKNSILIVEYIVQAQQDGVQRYEAIIDACQKRARPILMTTIAMMAGMLPVALSFGNADTSFRSPMAITVIGGLFTSTLLSLLVIPVTYSLIDDLKIWILRKSSLTDEYKI